MCRKSNTSFLYKKLELGYNKETIIKIIDNQIFNIKHHIYENFTDIHEYEENFNDIKVLNYLKKDINNWKNINK